MAKVRKTYSIEEKEKYVKRMLPPENCSIADLSRETGIHKSTLCTWKSKFLKGKGNRNSGRPKNTLSSREKFTIVMETYALSEIELTKYCRENGLYVLDVKKWHKSCTEANETKYTVTENIEDVKSNLIEEKKKTKELEKELRIKDKALAETTALLVLKKKLNSIFEENLEGQ